MFIVRAFKMLKPVAHEVVTVFESVKLHVQYCYCAMTL